jgi:hypothetical protein
MQYSQRRVVVFFGAFGSGKTELAINYAKELRSTGEAVTLVDLDNVSPLFRTRDAHGRLRTMGIRLLSPGGELGSADLPVLPAEVYGALQSKDARVVFDVGGDDWGARALSPFRPYFHEGEYDAYFVVNTRRPFTRDVDGICRAVDEVQRASRLRATALVANTNIGAATTLEYVREGFTIVSEAAERLHLPLIFLGVTRRLLAEASAEGFGVPLFPVDIFMLPPWEADE